MAQSIRRLSAVLAAGVSLVATDAAVAQAPAPPRPNSLAQATLDDRELTVRVTCRRDVEAELRSSSSALRVAEIPCRAGRGRAAFRLTRREAARAASTSGLELKVVLEGAKPATLTFRRPPAPSSKGGARALSSSYTHWSYAYASCGAMSHGRELGFFTHGANFGYPPGTLFTWRGGTWTHNEYTGVQHYEYTSWRTTRAGFKDNTALYFVPGTWVQPFIQLWDGRSHFINAVPVTGDVSWASPNWCFFH